MSDLYNSVWDGSDYTNNKSRLRKSSKGKVIDAKKKSRAERLYEIEQEKLRDQRRRNDVKNRYNSVYNTAVNKYLAYSNHGDRTITRHGDHGESLTPYLIKFEGDKIALPEKYLTVVSERVERENRDVGVTFQLGVKRASSSVEPIAELIDHVNKTFEDRDDDVDSDDLDTSDSEDDESHSPLVGPVLKHYLASEYDVYTHCVPCEFTAPDGTIGVTKEIDKLLGLNLSTDDGDSPPLQEQEQQQQQQQQQSVHVRPARLPTPKSLVLHPPPSFYTIPSLKATLTHNLSLYRSTVTKGDVITVWERGRSYDVVVKDVVCEGRCENGGGVPAGNLVNCDLEVHFYNEAAAEEGNGGSSSTTTTTTTTAKSVTPSNSATTSSARSQTSKEIFPKHPLPQPAAAAEPSTHSKKVILRGIYAAELVVPTQTLWSDVVKHVEGEVQRKVRIWDRVERKEPQGEIGNGGVYFTQWKEDA